MVNSNDLVETEWLSKNLSKVFLLDGSWYLPNQKRNPRKEFEKIHIPGSQFFDIELISDQNNKLPHMIPDSKVFEKHVSNLGLKNLDHIVIYDGIGLQSAARVWWSFKVFGHQKISILNGGLPKWISENRPTEKKVFKKIKTDYKAHFKKNFVKNYLQVITNIKTKKEELIDARSKGRFDGIEPEPRKELISGNIPGSINLPFQELINQSDLTLKKPEEIKNIFLKKGITFNKPIITSCGSGITACILAFCLHLIEYEDYSVYDGSWSEWATKKNSPITRKQLNEKID